MFQFVCHRWASRSGAFSLIELLVVIAVIAVLLAVLLPVFGLARNAARDAMCASNQRQLTTAMILHANDNRGYFSFTSDSARDWFTIHYTEKYFSDPQATVCPRTRNVVDITKPTIFGRKPLPNPADPTTTIPGEVMAFHADLWQAAAHAHDESGGHSYETFSWTNTGIYPDNLVINQTVMMRRGSSHTPSQTYIILDSDQDAVNGANFRGEIVYNNLPDDASNNHGSHGLNVSFVDGSTRYVPRDNWIETTCRAGKMGAINYNRARQYEPRLTRRTRPDAGPGYAWSLD